MSDPKTPDQNDSADQTQAEELPDGSGPTEEKTTSGGDDDQFQG